MRPPPCRATTTTATTGRRGRSGSRSRFFVVRERMTRLLRTRLGGRLFALIALESILILSAVALAAWLRVGADWWLVLAVEGGFEKALYVSLICQVCLYYADLYNARIMNDRRELFVRVVQA